jgi:hypothetical protein
LVPLKACQSSDFDSDMLSKFYGAARRMALQGNRYPNLQKEVSSILQTINAVLNR